MNRQELIEKVYSRKDELNLTNPDYKKVAKEFLSFLINEDLKYGDITVNALFDNPIKAKAVIKAEEEGVIAGIEEISWLYGQQKIKVKKKKEDGE